MKLSLLFLNSFIIDCGAILTFTQTKFASGTLYIYPDAIIVQTLIQTASCDYTKVLNVDRLSLALLVLYIVIWMHCCWTGNWHIQLKFGQSWIFIKGLDSRCAEATDKVQYDPIKRGKENKEYRKKQLSHSTCKAMQHCINDEDEMQWQIPATSSQRLTHSMKLTFLMITAGLTQLVCLWR